MSTTVPARKPRRTAIAPGTDLGRWAVALAILSSPLLLSWGVLGRLGGATGLVLGLVGGTAALVAIVRDGERGIAVYAAFLPFLGAVGFLLGSLVGD